MSNTSVIIANEIKNYEVQKLVETATEFLKLSIVQGLNSTMNPKVYKLKQMENTIGGKTRIKYPSVASVIAGRLMSYDAKRKNVVRLALARDTSITKMIRITGVNINSSKSILEEIDIKKTFGFINERTFNEEAMIKMEKDIFEIKDLPTGAVTATNNKQLKFKIHEVECIDETDPEWPGSDEISLGGVIVNDKGQTEKIPEEFVRGDFEAGIKKPYSPPEIIKIFDLDNEYPKKFAVTIGLAEKDSGGMSEFIQKLYEAINADIIKILDGLGGAAGQAIVNALKSSIGIVIAGPLGAIIGAAASAILNALIGWLASVLQDDIFKPQSSFLFLNSPNDTFAGGGLVSPLQSLDYQDFGGHYRIAYDWEISR